MSQATPKTKKIYVVISQTGTILSRVLKLITKKPYNHSSISLREDLHVLWSFGRRNPYNPIWGGFVQESPFWGTFKRFRGTVCAVMEMEITAEAYHDLEALFENMLQNRNHYHYNHLGLYLASVGIPRARKNHYYCSEFVRAMLIRARAPESDRLPAITHPLDFQRLPHRLIYTGSLQDYAASFPRTDI